MSLSSDDDDDDDLYIVAANAVANDTFKTTISSWFPRWTAPIEP
jgi:hypothetical protein